MTFAWLTEVPQPFRTRADFPEYYAGAGFTDDHRRAIRYARQIDAQRAIGGLSHLSLPPLRAVEHGWDE